MVKRKNNFLRKVILFGGSIALLGATSLGLVSCDKGSAEAANKTVKESSVLGQGDNTDKKTEKTDKKAEESKDNKVVETSDATIHFINTGNSDSILIVQGDKSALIDGGDNDDEGKVTKYIKKQGIKELTYVINTHPDADHCGGLDAVFKDVKVQKLLVGNGSADTKTYRDFINAAANKGVNPSVPLEGSEHKLSETSYLKFFNTNGGKDKNESSLVTLFVNGNDKFLFMGDAGEETENEIINDLPDVDLIKIGHHGSKYSTSEALLNKVAPEYAVILTGDNNYGHPTKEVLDKIKAKGAELHRTDECGDIIIKSTGKGIETTCKEGSFTPGDSKNSTSSSGNNKNFNEAKNNTTTKTESYTDGNKTTTNNNGAGNTGSNNGTGNTGNNNVENKAVENTKTVYWVPKGKSYHYSKSCSTLSRSKEILSGSLSECPKDDPCDRCT
ncbi:MBL fold metallo-hydrolase [uncultured Clostridium sp.]|uniref:ComEC/Rec2 family competence protein n=1 Tax=uncultured Clostridium sp. TaxID=59620 RepID=UPI00262FA4AF|nr:MBL fold metallo-hydrolase [uncultured Clostridium sp.]